MIGRSDGAALPDGWVCVCVFALEMQHEARKRAAEVAGGEEASCTIAVLGNSYEGIEEKFGMDIRERRGFVTLGTSR